MPLFHNPGADVHVPRPLHPTGIAQFQILLPWSNGPLGNFTSPFPVLLLYTCNLGFVGARPCCHHSGRCMRPKLTAFWLGVPSCLMKGKPGLRAWSRSFLPASRPWLHRQQRWHQDRRQQVKRPASQARGSSQRGLGPAGASLRNEEGTHMGQGQLNRLTSPQRIAGSGIAHSTHMGQHASLQAHI